MNLGLEGRVALVTGGSSGIGRAAAEIFAAEHARVAITYRSNREAAESVVEQIRQDGGEALALELDLASVQSIREGVDATAERLGSVDILVNNAVQWGAVISQPPPAFEQIPIEEWQPSMRTNIEGAFVAVQCVVPMMRKKNWGRIVNVSATIAEDGLPGHAWYSMAKASLHGLTRTLSKELGPAGILVNCVMPGLTKTDRTADLFSAGMREVVVRSTPIRRIIEPAEVASTIVFLCSAINTVVTGELIRSSGGR